MAIDPEDLPVSDEVVNFINEYKRTFLYLKVCMTIIVIVQIFLLFK